jgi:hypothetical protein
LDTVGFSTVVRPHIPTDLTSRRMAHRLSLKAEGKNGRY